MCPNEAAAAPCAACGAPHPGATCGSTRADPGAAPPGRPAALPAPGQAPLASPDAAADPLLGQMLGNFRIVRRLGAGGMGVVYLGEHAAIGSRVAVKMLHPHLASDPHLVERFFAEAKAVNLVAHENIVSIFDLNLLPPNRYYLVMELLDGTPLASLLGRGPLDPRIGIPILAQACDALQAAHSAGVIHRDLKPENVFLVRRAGNERFVKIVDFGIAKLFTSAPAATMAGLVVGTPEYMPPEQWTGGEVDGRLDLYALGVIAYAMAGGRLPFTGDTLAALYHAHLSREPPPLGALNPAVPPAFEALVRRALAKRREDRFQSAAELKAELLRVLADLDAPVAHPPAAPRPAAKPRSHRVRASWPGRPAALEAEALDVSRAGAFVCAAGPLPPLRARCEVAVLHPGGAVDLEAEVVRHVSAEQARGWGMSAGFAVQFVAPTLAARNALDRLARGEALESASAAPLPDDPSAQAVLDRYRARPSDPYALLAAAPDTESAELRHRARQAIAELDALAPRMSPRQRSQADALLERIHAAITVLGTPAWRAEHDAGRGNFRGVARCLGAGLGATELAALRKNFLASHPGADGTARAHRLVAAALEKEGRVDEALEGYERALRTDPLDLELQQAYWSLRRARAQGTAR